jgi:hypothetical protein
MPGFTAREFTGIVRWPLYRLCRHLRDSAKTLKSRLLRHECGRIIYKRVNGPAKPERRLGLLLARRSRREIGFTR